MTGESTALLAELLDVARECAEAAGAEHRAGLNRTLDIAHKSNTSDLVTDVDRAAEDAVRAVLARRRPEDAIVGEEGGATGAAPVRWLIDPVDGTTNYAHRFPFFAVSVAAEAPGGLAAGAILDVSRDELFTAVRGGGAFLNGRQISVSRTARLADSLVATGFGYDFADTRANLEEFAAVLARTRSVRRPGAASLDLAYVACGRLDAFWELQLGAWDVAAGMLLIREAGGVVTGLDGSSYPPGEGPAVASNGLVHAELLGVLEGARTRQAAPPG